MVDLKLADLPDASNWPGFVSLTSLVAQVLRREFAEIASFFTLNFASSALSLLSMRPPNPLLSGPSLPNISSNSQPCEPFSSIAYLDASRLCCSASVSISKLPFLPQSLTTCLPPELPCPHRGFSMSLLHFPVRTLAHRPQSKLTQPSQTLFA